MWISVEKNDKVDQVLEPKFREKLRPGHWEYNSNKHIFYVKCGANNWSEIVIKSQESGRASYEGSKVDRLAFDEQPDEQIFDSALIRTVDTRGQVLVAATMWEFGITWLYDRFIVPYLEGKRDDLELVGKDLPMESNPMLDPQEISEQRRQTALRSPEESAVRFDGKYIPIGGLTPFNLEALKQYRDNQGKAVEAELYYGGN
jgi:phage terminase large subunit-like protein